MRKIALLLALLLAPFAASAGRVVINSTNANANGVIYTYQPKAFWDASTRLYWLWYATDDATCHYSYTTSADAVTWGAATTWYSGCSGPSSPSGNGFGVSLVSSGTVNITTAATGFTGVELSLGQCTLANTGVQTCGTFQTITSDGASFSHLEPNTFNDSNGKTWVAYIKDGTAFSFPWYGFATFGTMSGSTWTVTLNPFQVYVNNTNFAWNIGTSIGSGQSYFLYGNDSQDLFGVQCNATTCITPDAIASLGAGTNQNLQATGLASSKGIAHIAYVDSTNTLYYVQRQPNGAISSADAVAVLSGSTFPHIAIVNGNPVIYYEGPDNKLYRSVVFGVTGSNPVMIQDESTPHFSTPGQDLQVAVNGSSVVLFYSVGTSTFSLIALTDTPPPPAGPILFFKPF